MKTLLLFAITISASASTLVCLPIQEEPICPNDASAFTLGFAPDPQPPYTPLVPNMVAPDGDEITKVTAPGYPLYIVDDDEYAVGTALPGLSSFDYEIDDTTLEAIAECMTPPVDAAAVPEPATFGMIGLTLLMLSAVLGYFRLDAAEKRKQAAERSMKRIVGIDTWRR